MANVGCGRVRPVRAGGDDSRHRRELPRAMAFDADLDPRVRDRQRRERHRGHNGSASGIHDVHCRIARQALVCRATRLLVQRTLGLGNEFFHVTGSVRQLRRAHDSGPGLERMRPEFAYLMHDLINSLYRKLGLILMLLGALVGAATCGVQYGQTHGNTNGHNQ